MSGNKSRLTGEKDYFYFKNSCRFSLALKLHEDTLKSPSIQGFCLFI